MIVPRETLFISGRNFSRFNHLSRAYSAATFFFFGLTVFEVMVFEATLLIGNKEIRKIFRCSQDRR